MSDLRAVRPDVLRRYYEAAYGKEAVPPATFVGATVAEYLALGRIRYPDASDRTLLERAPRELGFAVPPNPPPVASAPTPPSPPWGRAARLESADLDTLVAEHGPRLLLDTVQRVTGIERAAAAGLTALHLLRCGGEPLAMPARHSLEELEVRRCEPAFANAVLASFAPARLWFESEDPRPWSARPLAGDWLGRLMLQVPRPDDVQPLADHPVEEANVSRLVRVEDAAALVAAWRPRLRRLRLGSAVPIPPAAIGECPQLRRLQIEAYEEFRAEWVQWAVDHPQVTCLFEPHWTFAQPIAEVTEVYRGIPIVRCKEGRTTRWRMEDDLVDLFDLPFADNGELEDHLRQAAAARAKKKIAWGSEAGTLVATAAKVELCRWVIDQALASRKR